MPYGNLATSPNDIKILVKNASYVLYLFHVEFSESFFSTNIKEKNCKYKN